MKAQVFTSKQFLEHPSVCSRRYGTLDTKDQDFIKIVVPLRNLLVRQGYTQKYDFIKYAPFDSISSHVFALDDQGCPIGVITVIDAMHAQNDILDYYHLPFNPGRTAVCTRFCALPNVSGNVSLTGARLLDFVINSLQAEGYEYVIGEMSPPYNAAQDVKGQADITSYHINVTGMRVIGAFGYHGKVPTVVIGKSLSNQGALRETEWRTSDTKLASHLEDLESQLRGKDTCNRYSSFLATAFM